MNHKRYQITAIALASILIALIARQTGWLTPVEYTLWDYRVKLLSDPEEHDPNIKIILIDQSSLDWAEANNGLSWPWPREMYTAITEFCKEGGAKAVIFDMLYSEPSVYGSTDDERFASALKSTNTVGAVVISDTQGSDLEWPPAAKNAVNTPVKQLPPDPFMKSRGSFPAAALVGSFNALGSVVATPDDDGIVRRVQLMSYFDGVQLPTLSLAAYLNSRRDLQYRRFGNHACLGRDCFLLDQGQKAVIHFHGPSQTYDSFNAASVIESKLLMGSGRKPSLTPDEFNKSYVFVGVSAPGLMDQRTTPIQGVYPGVEIHATILDNLINHDFFIKTPFMIMFALMVLLTFFNTAGIRYHSSLIRASFYPFITLSMAAASGIVVYLFNGWLELAPLLATLLLSTLTAFTLNYLIEGRQRRFIRTAFAQYLSPQVIDSLIKQPESLKLGGEKKTLTLLFSDIEGFTKISSQMEAELVAQFLNEYLGLLSNAIMELGGTIDKYEGDAIIAFWNAPLPQENHAKLAVSAALRCQRLLQEHNSYFLQTYGHVIKTRFGIHTGEVIIGNLGTEKRFDYTFIGDAGNLAARLESANKQFGSYTMISEATRDAIGAEFYYRELGTIEVVGREKPIRVFEPMESKKGQEKAKIMQDYHAALQTLGEGDFEEAKRRFSPLADSDPVSKKYSEIIDRIQNKTALFENGVLKLREK